MNWKYKINIKDKFKDETTPEHVIELCKALIHQLKRIKKYELENEELEEAIDHFEFLSDLLDGTIPEEEWENYSFDGNCEEWFNGYLYELFDLGDTFVNKDTKFIWVG